MLARWFARTVPAGQGDLSNGLAHIFIGSATAKVRRKSGQSVTSASRSRSIREATFRRAFDSLRICELSTQH